MGKSGKGMRAAVRGQRLAGATLEDSLQQLARLTGLLFFGVCSQDVAVAKGRAAAGLARRGQRR